MVRVGAVIRDPDQPDVAVRPALGWWVAWHCRLPVLAIGREHEVPGRIDARCR